MSFATYILRCADGKYYVGHTDDLDRRIAQHHGGAIEGVTWNRRPITLAWSGLFPTRDEAIAAERQLKGCSRTRKEALSPEIGIRSGRRRANPSIRGFDRLSPYSGWTEWKI